MLFTMFTDASQISSNFHYTHEISLSLLVKFDNENELNARNDYFFEQDKMLLNVSLSI